MLPFAAGSPDDFRWRSLPKSDTLNSNNRVTVLRPKDLRFLSFSLLLKGVWRSFPALTGRIRNPPPCTSSYQKMEEIRKMSAERSCAIPIPCIRRNATARQISQAPVNVPERIQEVTGASYSQLSHSGGVSPPICAILQLFGVRNLLRQKLQSTQDSAGCVLHSRTGFVD